MTVTAQNPRGRSQEAPPPPAYFLSLTVANLRCFGPEPQTLDVSDGNGRPAQWTVLLGENGVGKTTLLQCFAAMQPFQFQSEVISAQYLWFPTIGNRSINWFRAFFEKADSLLGRDDLSYESALRLSAKIGLGAAISIYEHPLETFEYSFEGNSSAGSANAAIGDLSELKCYGYGASRRSRQTALSERRTEDLSASLFDDSVDLINAEEWLLQTSYAASTSTRFRQKREAKKRLERVKSLLINGILPDVSELKFGTSNDTAMTPQDEAKTPYGWVRVSELSLGYKTALTWMVDLASRLFERYPDSENPLAEPAVVLVDEIDLHLHPKWQRVLVQKLTETFPNTQFIVTAHSPLIVQAAPNANLALLKREGDHVVIDNDVDEIRNWRVDQILTSDLFGLTTARPPRFDQAFAERERILSQPTLTEGERKRLAELQREIEAAMPIGENPAEIRAMDALRLATAALERKANR